MLYRRYLCIALLVSCVASTLPVLAQPGPPGHSDSTTVVVLGTVHNPTQLYDLRVLTDILGRIKPDLILARLVLFPACHDAQA